MAVARIPFVALGVSMLVAACSAAPEEIGVESSALGSNQCVSAKEQSTANIACPAGQTITKVVFASYGTPAGVCGGFSAGACNASTSTSVLSSKCVGKNACQIGSNNGVFGDPCPGTQKTLLAQVECSGGGGTTTPIDPTPTQGSSQVCASVNQNANAVLTCPSGQTISSIGFASYGTPTGACGSFAASSCNEPSSKSKVEAECLGKSTCTINANDGYFGDPCWGVSKALKIQATCSGSTSGEPTTPTTPPTPPATSDGKVYLGAYPGNGGCVYPAIENCVSWYEQQVGKKMAIVHAFSSFENGWDDWFTRVSQSGHTLMLTINPASKAIPDILAGVYDADLKRWGKAAADHSSGPIFFRYMHEMNLPNNPAGWMADHYGAANYIAAFRRVHDMLNAGAGSNTKIIHVWAPNVFWGAANASNSIWFKPYYPGDAYADWVGLDGYPMSPTDSFDAQFGPSLALLESMTSHPIMIAEYGVVEMNPVGTWKANWFTDLFGAQVGKHPQLKALFYQDGTDGGTDHRIDTSAQAVAAFKAAIAPAKFASSYP
ncbi:glycosyl hydrolase [Labilithrix luteola]|nr:glycosyl hydrolase [Labilithrix luteola]